MRSFDQYRKDIFSQTGEDGILEEIFRRLDIRAGSFVEFGAHDGKYCSNTRLLLEKGWRGKLLEAEMGHSKALIDNTIGLPAVLHFGPVTADNINDLLPPEINLMSIDIDNDDYHVWKAYKGNADVVVIEVNSSIAPPEIVIPGTRGSSYSAMVELGISKGYFLLTHHGNCIFVHNVYRELFPEIVGDGIENACEYFSTAWL